MKSSVLPTRLTWHFFIFELFLSWSSYAFLLLLSIHECPHHPCNYNKWFFHFFEIILVAFLGGYFMMFVAFLRRLYYSATHHQCCPFSLLWGVELIGEIGCPDLLVIQKRTEGYHFFSFLTLLVELDQNIKRIKYSSS